MSDTDAREEARFQLLEESRIKLGTLLIPDSRTGSLRRAKNEDIGWFCDWLTRYETLLAAESQRTQAPSEQLRLLKALSEIHARGTRKWRDGNSDYQALIGDIEAMVSLSAEAIFTTSLAGTQAQAAQWISVEEKLPPIGEIVPVIVYGYLDAGCRAYRTKEHTEWCWLMWHHSTPNSSVTLWFDLPVAPVAALEGKP